MYTKSRDVNFTIVVSTYNLAND
uniref:Uncharacterized protein n=1 Tax=Arundo donax TaxID=35708 RepID=A0A0A9GW56_ARUDO